MVPPTSLERRRCFVNTDGAKHVTSQPSSNRFHPGIEIYHSAVRDNFESIISYMTQAVTFECYGITTTRNSCLSRSASTAYVKDVESMMGELRPWNSPSFSARRQVSALSQVFCKLYDRRSHSDKGPCVEEITEEERALNALPCKEMGSGREAELFSRIQRYRTSGAY